MSDRVTADDVTGIDEIVLTGVNVHIEAMSDKLFVMTFWRPDGFLLQADLWSKRAPVMLKLLSADEVNDSVEIENGVWK